MALDKARRHMANRQATILGSQMAGLPPGTMRNSSGVVVPIKGWKEGAHGTTLWGDEQPKPKGRLIISTRERGSDGAWDEYEVVEDDDNLVVRQAERLMANMAAGIANSAINYIELGDPAFPANTPALADINLQQTTGERKVAIVTVNANVLTVEVTWLTSEGNGFTYTESGLFTGLLGAGSMFARKTYNPIAKTSSFEMKFTWLVTFLVATQGGDCAGVALTGPQTVSNETIFVAVGGEASIAATFDFAVGAAHLDVFLNGQRLVRSRSYLEIPAGGLTPPTGGGPPGNKGIDLIGFTAQPGDVFYLVQRISA